MDLKIIGWTDYDSSYPSANITNETMNDYISCVVNAIVESGYMFSGKDHQNSDTGVPVFSDGTCLRASMRTWGTIMTFAYPEIDGCKTDYMDFYISVPDKSVMPEETEISISPADSNNFSGMITQQDGELLSQTIQMGMPLMTTDKTLNAIMDGIKLALESDEEGEEN